MVSSMRVPLGSSMRMLLPGSPCWKRCEHATCALSSIRVKTKAPLLQVKITQDKGALELEKVDASIDSGEVARQAAARGDTMVGGELDEITG